MARATESVWDYPRPPGIERDDRHVVVRMGQTTVADTTEAWRVCETSSPPTFYLPIAGITPGVLERVEGRSSFCEWKGAATYYDVVTVDGTLPSAAWGYDVPTRPFEDLAGTIAFYPHHLECLVDGERVRPQDGAFYGGWITDELIGPFKGGPGTQGW